MAITQGKINGNELLLYVNGSAVACCLNHSLQMSTEEIDVTTKDSDGWKEIILGLRSWIITGEGLTEFSATYGFNDLVTVWKNKTMVTIQFKTDNTDDKVFSGSAYITELSEDAAMNDATSFSFTMQGTGVLSYAVII